MPFDRVARSSEVTGRLSALWGRARPGLDAIFRGTNGRRIWAACQRASPLRAIRLDCQIRVWYNRSVHELALVDRAGAGPPATGLFSPPVCHSCCRPGKLRGSPCQRPHEQVGSALKTRQLRHRDPGLPLAVVSGHLRRSDDDLLESFVQESSFLLCKLVVSTYRLARLLSAPC